MSELVSFMLVKAPEGSSTQYKFNPFLGWDKLVTKKELTKREWSGHLFLLVIEKVELVMSSLNITPVCFIIS